MSVEQLHNDSQLKALSLHTEVMEIQSIDLPFARLKIKASTLISFIKYKLKFQL